MPHRVSATIVFALFLTNVWIVLYTKALALLNRTFPQTPSQEFIRAGANPEPFEIPLYLLLTAIFTLCIGVFFRFFLASVRDKLRDRTVPTYIAAVLIIALVAFLLQYLNGYPMGRDTYPLGLRFQSGTYQAYFLGYVIIVAVMTSALFFMSRSLVLLYSLIVLTVALFTFEPRFPISGHDYSYFFGPIWEIVHGKTIFTDTSSQYGLLSILLMGLLYRLELFDIWYLPTVVWIAYIIQYFLVFYLVYKLGKSRLIALIALFSVITVNYYSLFHLPGTYPQIGPFRWLVFLVPVVVFYKVKRMDSKVLIFVLALASVWMVDSGIALLLAYGFLSLVFIIKGDTQIRRMIYSIGGLIVAVLSIAFLVNLLHVTVGMAPIHFTEALSLLRQYAREGFGMLPIPDMSFFWLVLMFYFLSIVYYFREEKNTIGARVLVFFAHLSLFASTYYVGRSHPHNLFHISIFPITNAFLLSALWYRRVSKVSLRLTIVVALFLIAIAYPTYQRQEAVTEMLIEKQRLFSEGDIFKPETPRILEEKYRSDITLIKKHIKGSEALIFAADDTYLFYLTDKKNLMRDNSQFTLLTKEDVNRSMKKAYSVCPAKIVGECRLFDRCSANNPLTMVYFDIQSLLLKKLQDRCGVEYKPLECADELCIATSG